MKLVFFKKVFENKLLALALLGVIIVYFPALWVFFSQDDFTHLYVSQASSIKDVLNFFVPLPTGIFYRPLSVQFYTWISTMAFGLKPFGFHAVALLLHLVNTLLVFKILKKLTKDKLLGLVGAFLYGIHVSHFMSIFWAAEFSMVLAPFFAFLAINYFLRKRYVLFWLSMILGLLSNELTSTVPLILGVYLIFRREWNKIGWLIPSALGVVAVFLLRFVWFPASLGSQYLISLTFGTFYTNLRWQLFRALGLIEGFRGHMNLLAVRVSVFALALALLVLIYAVWRVRREKFFRRFSQRQLMLIIFGLSWFTLSLLPVLFLISHQSPIYQIIGLPGFLLALMVVVKQLKMQKVILGIFVGLYFVASFWGTRAQNEYHWVTKRARLAKYHIEKLEKHNLSSTSVVNFLNTLPKSSTQAYLAMAGDKAVKVFFGETIRAEFEDFSELVFSEDAVYIFSQPEI